MAGWSELIFGSMYCGKSEELIRRLKRVQIAGQHYQLFKPAIDNRYGIDRVVTHESNQIKKSIEKIIDFHVDNDTTKENLMNELAKQIGGAIQAEAVASSAEILDKVYDYVDVVGIDEVQFFDSGLIEVVEELKARNKRVILAGLDMYANAKPFGDLMKEFACTSKYVDKLHAVCVDCGEDAYISYKLTNSDPSKIDVGSVGKYIALCEKCAEKRKKIYEEKNNNY